MLWEQYWFLGVPVNKVPRTLKLILLVTPFLMDIPLVSLIVLGGVWHGLVFRYVYFWGGKPFLEIGSSLLRLFRQGDFMAVQRASSHEGCFSLDRDWNYLWASDWVYSISITLRLIIPQRICSWKFYIDLYSSWCEQLLFCCSVELRSKWQH